MSVIFPGSRDEAREYLAARARYERGESTAEPRRPPDWIQRIQDVRVALINIEGCAQLHIAELEKDLAEARRALRGLVYESDGRWYTGIYGDADVTDVVGAVLKGDHHG